MAKYAAKTEVSSEKSRSEIESTLRRYGANAFSYAYEDNTSMVAFRMNDRMVRFKLTMPDPADEEFTEYYRGSVLYERSAEQARKLWEQATRQKWRALALVVKAKLEAVESGISEFEEEFLAHIVLPDNTTVGEQIRPAIERAYIDGKMPRFLLSVGDKS